MISGIKHKGIMAAICVLAAIALFAGLGGSTRDNLLALTVGTEHGNAHHDILLVKRTSSWHTSGSKSTSETLPVVGQRCTSRDPPCSHHAITSLSGAEAGQITGEAAWPGSRDHFRHHRAGSRAYHGCPQDSLRTAAATACGHR